MEKDRQLMREIKELDILLLRKNRKEFQKNFSCDLGLRQTLIIVYLLEHEKNTVYQKDLEQELNVRRSTLTGVLNTMEKNGLIKRIESNKDARLKEVVLTEKTNEKYQVIYAFIDRIERELVQGISLNELHIFFKVIDKMKENLK